MTEEEYERGLELQGYRKSIEDMTLGDIALKFLKKYHLPKFLKRILVKFAHPLLLLKDVDLVKANKENAEQLAQAKKIIKEMNEGLDKLYLSGLSDKKIAFIERLQDKAEQFLKENDDEL